jgi:hypothetical protein
MKHRRPDYADCRCVSPAPNPLPGRRGWIVVALFVLVAFSLAGFMMGKRDEAQRWERWNYAHVAWDGKGNKAP